jgi:hypothetical protein
VTRAPSGRPRNRGFAQGARKRQDKRALPGAGPGAGRRLRAPSSSFFAFASLAAAAALARP